MVRQRKKDVEKIDVSYYKSSLYEDNEFCIEGSHDLDSGKLDMITFTDKRNQKYPFNEREIWDNPEWFKLVLKGDAEAISGINIDYVDILQKFLKEVM